MSLFCRKISRQKGRWGNQLTQAGLKILSWLFLHAKHTSTYVYAQGKHLYARHYSDKLWGIKSKLAKKDRAPYYPCVFGPLTGSDLLMLCAKLEAINSKINFTGECPFRSGFQSLAPPKQICFVLFYFRCGLRTICLASDFVFAVVAKFLGFRRLGELAVEPVGGSTFWQGGAVIGWPMAGEMDFRRDLRRMRNPAQARQ